MLCFYVKYDSVPGLDYYKQICFHPPKYAVMCLDGGQDMEQCVFLVTCTADTPHPWLHLLNVWGLQ